MNMRTSVVIFLALFFVAPQFSAAEGKLRVRACPFSCRLEGIPKNVCRDWRKGNQCFVEDLRKPRNRSNGWNKPTVFPPSYGPRPQYQPRPPYQQSCRVLRGRHLPKPRIDIQRIQRAGNGDRYYVYGTVSGRCLSEAGYYERGKKREEVAVTTFNGLTRTPFTLRVRANRLPEIRVYNTYGGSNRIDLSARLASYQPRYPEHRPYFPVNDPHYGHNHDGHEHNQYCDHGPVYESKPQYPWNYFLRSASSKNR